MSAPEGNTPDKPSRKTSAEKYKTMRGLGIGLTIPMLLAASIVVSSMIGYYLDNWLGTGPWLTLLFLFLGIATGIRETILLIRKIEK